MIFLCACINYVPLRKPFMSANGVPLIHHREPPKLDCARFGEPRPRSPFPSGEGTYYVPCSQQLRRSQLCVFVKRSYENNYKK